MQGIYDWIKNLVYFYILMTAVLHLLPKSNYQKYVRFFGGLLLVVLLISPVLEFFRHPDVLLERVSYESFWQEMDTVRLDMAGLEEVQQSAYRAEYEKAIAQDISLMAREENLQTVSAKVKLSEDCRVASVTLLVIPDGAKEGVFIEKITFSDSSSAYPGVLELKQKIMEFYEVPDDRIQIAVQEG